MKNILVATYIILCGCVVRGEDSVKSVIGDAFGDPFAGVLKIIEASKDGDSRGIYNAMSNGFKKTCSFEKFSSSLKRDWRLLSIKQENIKMYPSVCILIASIEEVDNKGRGSSVEALFLSQDRDGWKLVNFPFYKSGVQEYYSLPLCFRTGFADQSGLK